MVQHLAIIMDGNGRWAQERGRARAWGHREGVRRVDEIVEACVERGISHLSLYAFSTENWNRPASEVKMLMRLVVQYLRRMDRKLQRNSVSLVAQGSLERLPDFVRVELDRVVKMTHLDAPKMKLNLCLSYGGRQEIVDAARALAQQVEAGTLKADAITQEHFAQNLYHPEFPEPDLLIRTGGEYRVSNFLLWQIAYSELYVTETLWPAFITEELDAALEEFNRRERRFGKTSAQIKPTHEARA